MPPKVTEYFDADQLISVRLQVRGRTRPIKGAKTGVFYGRFKAGDEFQIHRDDYAAHPVWFQLVQPQAAQPIVASTPFEEALYEATTPPQDPEPTPFDLTSVKGVGDATAAAIVKRFASTTAQDVVALTVDQLLSIPGLSRLTAETIIKTAEETIHAPALG